jgi:hypothetical protein
VPGALDLRATRAVYDNIYKSISDDFAIADDFLRGTVRDIKDEIHNLVYEVYKPIRDVQEEFWKVMEVPKRPLRELYHTIREQLDRILDPVESMLKVCCLSMCLFFFCFVLFVCSCLIYMIYINITFYVGTYN